MIKDLNKMLAQLESMQKAQQKQFDAVIGSIDDHAKKKMLIDAFNLAKSGKADVNTIAEMLKKLQ